jgi:hypothetical protein
MSKKPRINCIVISSEVTYNDCVIYLGETFKTGTVDSIVEDDDGYLVTIKDARRAFRPAVTISKRFVVAVEYTLND